MGKAEPLAAHVLLQGENEGFIYSENGGIPSSEADHAVLSLGDPVLSDLDFTASCKAEMQVFAHSAAELLRVPSGAGKGPRILQLD